MKTNKTVDTPLIKLSEIMNPQNVKDAKPTQGLRFNTGKLRYDLLDTDAIEGLVKILTYGADKYTIKDENGNILTTGADNWRNGMSWSTVIASLKRHLAAIEKGEDFDLDPKCEQCKNKEFCKNHSQNLHIDHILCNAMFLSAYYKLYPQGDDRRHKYLKVPNIGLDIDNVLCQFSEGWCERFNMPIPTSWSFDRNIVARFEDMRNNNQLDDFYLNLKPLVKPEDIPFEPKAYITSRPVSTEISQKWLDMHGFPGSKVITVGLGESKIEAAKKANIQVFVDDHFENFKELNNAGITCFLFDAPHNQRHQVGHKRIKALNELPWFKK